MRLLALLLVPAPALATDVSVGAQAGVSIDLPDPTSSDHTAFSPGPSLTVPVRVGLAPGAYLRAALRADMGVGSDRVSWAASRGGEDVRIASSDHWAMLTAASLVVGLEGRIEDELPVEPLLGFGVGGAWVATWHSFGPSDDGTDTTFLLDPEQNDLNDPNNRDPYAMSFTPMVDVYVGGALPLSDALEVGLEIGYSVAFLPDAALQSAPPDIDARRDAFGWNALRIQVGAATTF